MAQESKDPVCGMNVDPKTAQFKSKQEGKDVSFCSKECMEKFKKNPNQYHKH